jgi:hypothetical protein
MGDGLSHYHNSLERMSMQLFPSEDLFTTSIQQASSEPTHDNYAPGRSAVDICHLGSDFGQQPAASYSTSSLPFPFGLAKENGPPDFSPPIMPARTPLPSQVTCSKPMGLHTTLSQPNPSSAVAFTSGSNPSTINPQPRMCRLLPKEPSLPRMPLQLPRLGNGGKEINSFSPSIRTIRKNKSDVPRYIMNCIKYPFPANSPPQSKSRHKKQRSCLMCFMHKK